MTDPRAPADFLAPAQHMLDTVDPATLAAPDFPVALLDQIRASERDASAAIKHAADLSQDAWRQTTSDERRRPSARNVAWRMAVMSAAGRRVERNCPHLPMPPGSPVVIDLTFGIGACGPCLRAWSPDLELVQDWRCDVCDEPCEEFTPFMANVLGIAVGGHICDACVEWSSTE